MTEQIVQTPSQQIAWATIRFINTIMPHVGVSEEDGKFESHCVLHELELVSDSIEDLSQQMLHGAEAVIRMGLRAQDKVFFTYKPTMPIIEFREHLRVYENEKGEEVFDIYIDTLRRTVQKIEDKINQVVGQQ